jgi:hypothetical protein
VKEYPWTAEQCREYAEANLENALKQTKQGFPDRALANTKAALKLLEWWREKTQ